MDLAGPKLRIGPFKPGPNVKKIKPLKDARGKGRLLKITEKFPISSDIGCWAECSETAYVESGTEFHVKRKNHKIGNSRVAELPTVQQYVQVKTGDLLVITRNPCLAPSLISNNDLSGPPQVTCSLGLLFDSVKPGEPIEFDDGEIKGVIRGVNISEICVEITHAGQNGSKLGAEKSINVPRSNLHFEGLTVKDMMDLDFIAANADLVGVSFVNDVNDVNILQQELDKRKLKNLGIVLKIETKGGFERLPLLLLQAMRSPNPLGVMIARGDLAVECGWEKLAEMQEEILSLCEAAHIPSIWETQALGKAIAASGLVGDATPFRPITVESITEQLKICGYQPWGKEQMYNGRTGGKMQTRIVVGPTYYQRLIHMAEDKIKYRNHGPVHPLTRQPVADRKRHEGVKFGEMERDCMLAHGATANLLERLFYLSDFSSMHVCGQCRMLATVVLRDGVRGPYCPFCKTAKHVVKVNVPYACKLLYHELFSMGICLRFSTELC